jgi:hypothetical protein
MKKTLSFVLVAAMLLCMIPAFSLFAGELDLTTIDTPDELVALAEAANAAGRDYRRGETVKVTADLDMTGKNYTPINKGIFTLDFQGHTLSNLNVTVENPGGDVGLLAHRLENNNANGLITNVKIKNCSLTVKGNASSNVGIVGYADRANVTNVEIDGFTINHEGAGNVGVLKGAKAWGFDSNISATMKNVVIDAPYANVAVVCGKVEGEPLEHNYVDGTCTGCGKDEPVQGTVVTNTEVFAGLTAAGQYKTVTTTSGWTAVNAAVLTGGTKDANPVFQFIGATADSVAICLNGKTTTVGKLTSATLQGGISKLSFSYGNAFSESKGVDITINILQGGAVVATTTLDNDSVTQKTAYEFVWELDNVVNGEFVIEIVNNCPSNNASSNKDRVAIFNFSWDSAPVAA